MFCCASNCIQHSNVDRHTDGIAYSSSSGSVTCEGYSVEDMRIAQVPAAVVTVTVVPWAVL
jgi:hypothetical protein